MKQDNDDLRIRKLRWLEDTLKELHNKNIPKDFTTPFGKITNAKLFIKSHAQTIRSVNIVSIYKPAVERLEILKNLLKK